MTKSLDKVQLRRDPFARATLMREKCGRHDTCTWCGNPARWIYYWESDSLRTVPRFKEDARPFCSISCWETYYGE
jgi:hypothetical protein